MTSRGADSQSRVFMEELRDEVFSFLWVLQTNIGKVAKQHNMGPLKKLINICVCVVCCV